MKKWLHKMEVIVDKVIPYLLIILLFLILVEIFFHKYVIPYEFWIKLADGIIIGFFALDLVFKYLRVRNIPKFLKKNWLDIIAVFPFFLIFRLFEEFSLLFNIGEKISGAQPLFHEALEIEKEGAKIISEGEKISKLSRTSMLARFLRPLERIPRFAKIFRYFEKPTGNHYLHEKKKRTK